MGVLAAARGSMLDAAGGGGRGRHSGRRHRRPSAGAAGGAADLPRVPRTPGRPLQSGGKRRRARRRPLAGTQSAPRQERHGLTPSETECRVALGAWLEKYGAEMYYDRLSRALQHIGRTDVALEVGKNINQDKILNLQRYAQGYHRFASSLKSREVRPQKGQKGRKKRVSELTWRDLDLVVLRPPVAAYAKGPLDVALPLLYGVLLGFGGSLLAAVAALLAALRLARWNRRCRGARVVYDCKVTA
ncbi:transmembrane and death domain protein 1-like isoform X2 [Entelurus aequoreus]|uniref:transmembrane and death domain protein 1-like isoform X2 n=1 Tax=Entelurus aequoreus TaxID=161455 RepID=UPI002B1D0452|nr:transmembrane and death domain protein 1-like isoform X2 [Entelurus aequoreus]XP_061908522.1 transmembrane and death domain protein 1-like isoform X2 [Entelurus aequoreus]